jgi:hypothetical protein
MSWSIHRQSFRLALSNSIRRNCASRRQTVEAVADAVDVRHRGIGFVSVVGLPDRDLSGGVGDFVPTEHKIEEYSCR